MPDTQKAIQGQWADILGIFVVKSNLSCTKTFIYELDQIILL